MSNTKITALRLQPEERERLERLSRQYKRNFTETVILALKVLDRKTKRGTEEPGK